MKSVSWKTVAEFAGIAGILVGLSFVFVELKLNSTIARAELNIFVNQSSLDINGHFSDPEFVSIYLQGLDSPEELTAADRQRLGAFYDRISNIFGFEYRNYLLGIFVEYEALPRILVRRYMTGQFARAWWEIRKESLPTAVVTLIDDELSRHAGANLELEFDSRLREKLRDRS